MTDFNSKGESRVPESLLSQIWKGQWLKQGPFPASDGRVVRVKWAGRENKDSGPDFLNAAIILDDEIVTGDIELHVRSSDWRSHGHHLDPHFNNVILQVVFWDDSKKPAQLENGDHIPTLPLREFLNGSMDDLAVKAESHQIPSLPCRNIGKVLGEKRIGEILDEYGIERFYLKSASFEIDLIIEEPEQVLYQRMMGALGYTKNKKAFEELARRLPYRVIENIIQEQELVNRTLMLQALLLGSAGLLPSQCDGKSKLSRSVEVGNLERAWDSLNVSDSMSYADWHFFRMHPKNFPTSRLFAAGYLLDRYLEEGLLKQVLELVREANPGKGATMIERGFVVPDCASSAKVGQMGPIIKGHI